MLQGAWFNSSTVLLPGVVSSARPNATRPLRFVRLVCTIFFTETAEC